MEIATLKTVAGKPADQIAMLLAEIFTDAEKAYKAVPGGADLTDINTGHMIERVTQVFGLKGLGWNFRWDPRDLVFYGDVAAGTTRVTAHLKNAIFSFALVDEKGEYQWFEIQTSGINQNSATYAEEGARTSALGAALKGLCFQLPIYKGYLDHHNAKQIATAVEEKRKKEAALTSHAGEQAQPEGAAAAKPAAAPAATKVPAARSSAAPKPAVAPAAASTSAPVAKATPAAAPAAAPVAAPAATGTAVAPVEAPTAETVAIPDKMPDGVNAREYIDGLADQLNLDEFVLPPGSNTSGQKLVAQAEGRIRWYAYSMRASNPKAMVLKVLAYRLLERKGLLKDGETHPLAS